MEDEQQIREPIAAGSFYPADPDKLSQQIKGFLADSKDFDLDDIKALVSPHAGYIYSGHVAAISYRQVMGVAYDLVVVIAPSHSEYFEHVSLYPGRYLRTPLGLIEVDKKNSAKLTESNKDIRFSNYGYRNEHSLEVQLPFIQTVLKDINIVPLVIGKQSDDILQSLGNTLGNTFKDQNILIIASTDLSHYHPYEQAVNIDKKVAGYLNDYDIDGLKEDFLSEELEMCGGGPVISAMIASKIMGAGNSKVLEYKNSGDVTGDKSAVVGYLSAAIY